MSAMERRIEQFDRSMTAILDMLVLRPRTYETMIRETAQAFTGSIRAAMGPDMLAQHARERYVRGEIDADDLDRELARIGTEFEVIP